MAAQRRLRRTYVIPESLHATTLQAAEVRGERISRYGDTAIRLLHAISQNKITPRHSKLITPIGSEIALPPGLSPVTGKREPLVAQMFQLELNTIDILEEDAGRAGITEGERMARALVFRNFVTAHCAEAPPTFTRDGQDAIVFLNC